MLTSVNIIFYCWNECSLKVRFIEKLKFILEQKDTDTVKNIWMNLAKMYEINKDTAVGGILFKATENKVLELTKNK